MNKLKSICSWIINHRKFYIFLKISIPIIFITLGITLSIFINYFYFAFAVFGIALIPIFFRGHWREYKKRT